MSFVKQMVVMFLSALLLSRCVNDVNKTKIAQKELQVLFVPKALTIYAPFRTYLLDSNAIASSKLKIYVSINFSCPTCIDKLKKWTALAKVFNKYNVPTIIIANADDRFEFIKYLNKQRAVEKFPYPYFLDKQALFYAKNKIINNSAEQIAILTYQDNRIIATGNLLNVPQDKINFINKIKQLQK